MSLKTDHRAWPGEVVVPGSIANLGPGFDTLGVAVQLYLRARILEVGDDRAGKLIVTRSAPPVRGQNALERAYDTAQRLTGRRAPTVSVEVTSDIPMAAGLGSSAAATVAGLRIFEAATGPVDERVLLAAATQLEGHADNAAPALLGGLNSVVQVEGEPPVALKWRWPDALRFVIATPAEGLATSKARAVLPADVTRADAIFNLQRALLLVHALQHGEYHRIREAVQDRWHQSARGSLVPLLDEALRLEDPAVVGVFLSGAGPSVAFVVHEDVDRVERLVAAMYQRAGCAVAVRALGVHHHSEMSGVLAEREAAAAMRDAVASVRGRTV